MAGALISPNGADSVWLSATDGRVCCVLKARCDGEVQGASIVPREVLPNRAGGGRIIHQQDGRWEDPKSGKIAEPMDAPAFPPIADILPDVTADGKYKVAIALNAAFLANVAKAIGRGCGYGELEPGDVVTLFIDEPNKPICVYGGEGRVGVIMPVKVEDSHRQRFADVVGEYQKAVKP